MMIVSTNGLANTQAIIFFNNSPVHKTLFPLVAVIGFLSDTYSVIEGIDQFSNLNVVLFSGQFGREVIVNFNTLNGSAIGW